jgi:hypothetical protein
MPIDPRAAAVYNFTLSPRPSIPIIRGWNRLEGRPRSEDFERSLRAEVRDPLWFLTRQWQYGEFEGEDAGSPIDARIAYRAATLDTYRVGVDSRPFDPNTPLEVRVEREAVPFDLMLHMQAARVFERLLGERGIEKRLSNYVLEFPLDYDHGVAGADTPEARALFDAGAGFLFDSASLFAAVRDGSHASRIAGFANLSIAERDDLIGVGLAVVAWYERTYEQPAQEASAWRPDRLGYAFGSAATGTVQLGAADHRGGDLDWHTFDVVQSEGAPASADRALTFWPTAIRFGGMPSSRFWEMEDGKTDFGRLDIQSNDLAKIMLTEFLLLYTDDWCLLPLDLPVGTFTRIEGVLVADVFGDRTLIRAADRGAESEWERWSMFRLKGDQASSPGLLLAPALISRMESPPIERVEFLRDEMANMVWAIESRVASKIGDPFDPALVEHPAPESNATGVRYVLGLGGRPNWRPFIPVHVPGSTRSIRLQRARLPDQPQQPQGRILDVPTPYFIAEEEVPRAGRTVTRSFQRARWIDGTPFSWIGRASKIGRGEGTSGLEFDRILEERDLSPMF